MNSKLLLVAHPYLVAMFRQAATDGKSLNNVFRQWGKLAWF